LTNTSAKIGERQFTGDGGGLPRRLDFRARRTMRIGADNQRIHLRVEAARVHPVMQLRTGWSSRREASVRSTSGAGITAQ
jgi:hypothetical protein